MQEKGHTFADLSSEVQEKARDQMVIGWCLDEFGSDLEREWCSVVQWCCRFDHDLCISLTGWPKS